MAMIVPISSLSGKTSNQSEVQEQDFLFSSIGVYDNNSDITTIILGDEINCTDTSKIPCNGPLIPSTRYRYVL